MSRLRQALLFAAVAFGVFSTARIALLALHLPAFEGLGPGARALALIEGLRFDAAVLARLLGLPLLVMALPDRLFDRLPWLYRGCAWLLFCLTLGSALLLAVDVIYFGYVGRHLSYELAHLDSELNMAASMAGGAHLPALLLFALFAGLLFLLWRRLLASPVQPGRWPLLRLPLLLLLLAIAGRGGLQGKVIEIIDAYRGGSSAYGHLVLNGVFTTMVFALNLNPTNHHFFPEAEALETLTGRETGFNPGYPLERRLAGPTTGRNLVFVLLESWNFRHVDSFGGRGVGATPSFDALARDGLRFTRCYAAGQRSIEGIQATLTGIPPLHGLPRIDAGIGVSNITRLGAVARGHGYATVFVQSSDRGSFKIDGVAAATGFEHYYGREDIPLRRDYAGERPHFGWDYDTLLFLKERLDQLRGPFLAYAFTGTTHEPYVRPPAEFVTGEHGPDSESGFLNTLRYADWSVGEFMAAARTAPWFGNTVFIFMADHANHFQAAARSGERVNWVSDEEFFPDRFHIPCLVYAPGFIPAGEDPRIASQLDLVPTAMQLLGFEDPFTALGESLLGPAAGRGAFVSAGSQIIGLMADEGWLAHSRDRRLAGGGWRQMAAGEALERIERRLLASDQLSFELLEANRWAH